MRSLVAIFPLAFLSSSVNAIAQDTMQIRATAPPSEKLIQAIVGASKPIKLSRSQFVGAENFSYKHIITALCGNSNDPYWSEVKKRNNLPSDLSVNNEVGSNVYDIEWPACAFVFQLNESIKVKVKPGDTAFSIYKALTGRAGTAVQIGHFFAQAQSKKMLEKLSPGDVLFASHASAFTSLSVPQNATYQESIGVIMAAANGGEVVIKSSISTSPSVNQRNPRFSITSGNIASANPKNYTPPLECAGADAIDYSDDAQKILNAYLLAQKDLDRSNILRSSVDVIVPDNGFFGARLSTSGELSFGPSFTGHFFYVGERYNNQLGPIVRVGEKTVYPINYSNELKSPTLISGHGTHIAGLILGGADYLATRSIFDMDGTSWLRIIPLNIGNGSDQLLVGSEQFLSSNLSLWKNKIINLSLTYRDDSDNPTILPIMDAAITIGKANNNLFIVAAGNEGNKDVQAVPYYPAALGGPAADNVITVAAHDHRGRLTKFTNLGRASVDIAARGCELPSWLDDTGIVTRMSGTSQAAASTTYGAELLASLGRPSAKWIKQRLVISGDLLEESDHMSQRPLDLYQNISSGSRLNIATALYTFHDYFRIRQPGTTKEVEFLGELKGMTDVRCTGRNEEPSENVWAIKVRGTRGLLFTGKTAGRLNAPCDLEMSTDSVLYAVPHIFLKGDVEPKLNKQMIIRADEIIQYVVRMIPD